ncbi:MAG TPA: TetR/AcrR family transcriptional regulator [Acidimicrobiia bacterium]|nr:TetR/AcrR family transcriptional regulator [Acidimicrobiia bacterium]
MSPRPRRPQDDVLQATLDVIAEQGVMGISVDTVATRSGVSKATIYRHWGSRARLIHAAISSLQPTTVEPDTGSLRDDLVRLLTQLVEYFDTPTVARVFPSFLDAAVRDAELAELRQETLRVGRASFERVVQLGIARGELADDVDVHLVADFARAPIIYRRVVAQVPVRVDEVEPIVDAVLAAFTAVPAVAMPERTNG